MTTSSCLGLGPQRVQRVTDWSIAIVERDKEAERRTRRGRVHPVRAMPARAGALTVAHVTPDPEV